MPKKRSSSRAASRGRLSSAASYTPSEPIAGPAAFEDHQDPSHVQSQAATMLLIGYSLRGDAPAEQARAGAARAIAGFPEGAGERSVDALPDQDLRTLGFPRLQAGAPRFRSADPQ